jgi:phage-related protein
MDEVLKPVCWSGDSLQRVRGFPKEAREDIGFQLDRVQRGLAPRDWKWATGVGPGVLELRVHIGAEYRVFYVAKDKAAVHVLHAFMKKTRKTPQAELELARRRYQELVREGRLR